MYPNTCVHGSGCIVSQDGLILTNAHVVLNKPNAIIEVNINPLRTFVLLLYPLI